MAWLILCSGSLAVCLYRLCQFCLCPAAGVGGETTDDVTRWATQRLNRLVASLAQRGVQLLLSTERMSDQFAALCSIHGIRAVQCVDKIDAAALCTAAGIEIVRRLPTLPPKLARRAWELLQKQEAISSSELSSMRAAMRRSQTSSSSSDEEGGSGSKQEEMEEVSSRAEQATTSLKSRERQEMATAVQAEVEATEAEAIRVLAAGWGVEGSGSNNNAADDTDYTGNPEAEEQLPAIVDVIGQCAKWPRPCSIGEKKFLHFTFPSDDEVRRVNVHRRRRCLGTDPSVIAAATATAAWYRAGGAPVLDNAAAYAGAASAESYPTPNVCALTAAVRHYRYTLALSSFFCFDIFCDCSKQ